MTSPGIPGLPEGFDPLAPVDEELLTQIMEALEEEDDEKSEKLIAEAERALKDPVPRVPPARPRQRPPTAAELNMENPVNLEDFKDTEVGFTQGYDEDEDLDLFGDDEEAPVAAEVSSDSVTKTDDGEDGYGDKGEGDSSEFDEMPAPGDMPPSPFDTPVTTTPFDTFSDDPLDRDDEDRDEDFRKKFSPLSKVGDWAGGAWSKVKDAPTRVKVGAGVAAALSVVGLVVSNMGSTPEISHDPVKVPTVAAPSTGPQGPESKLVQLMPRDLQQFCAPPVKSSPVFAFNGVDKDAWLCNRVLNIDGGVMNIDFMRPVLICQITIVPGWAKVEPGSNRDKWLEYRLTTKILWRIESGGSITSWYQDLDPQPTGNTINLMDLNGGKCVGSSGKMSLQIQESLTPAEVSQREGRPGSDGRPNPRGPEAGIDGNLPEVNDATAIMSIIVMGEEVGG